MTVGQAYRAGAAPSLGREAEARHRRVAWRCGAGQTLLIIGSPCVIESAELTLQIAEELAKLAATRPIQLVFKASFDKANRTSIHSYRGPGWEAGLAILRKVRETTGLP